MFSIIAANVSLLELVAENGLSSFRQDRKFCERKSKSYQKPPLVLVAVSECLFIAGSLSGLFFYLLF
jgi:hypothetical protein